MMSARVILGMLTPSSNTVLEPVASAMVSGLAEVSVHFGRFRVTEISLRDPALRQFDEAPMLEAARLLTDARVNVVCWNGTSAGWLGLESDRRLCATITRETGVPAVSSVLALAEIFRVTKVTRYGLVAPYLDEIQARIIDTLAAEGFSCAGERHLRDPGNFSFSEVTADTIDAMVREVAASRRRPSRPSARISARPRSCPRSRRAGRPDLRHDRRRRLGRAACHGRRSRARPGLGPPLRGSADRRPARVAGARPAMTGRPPSRTSGCGSSSLTLR